MALTFGYEYEVAGFGLSVLDELVGLGVVSSEYLHDYHCSCQDCRHDNYGPRAEWLFTAQQDCTVSAEFPSKVLTWGTDQAETAFLSMERAAVRAGAELDGDSGMHVHVGKPEKERVLRDDEGDGDALNFTTRQATTWRLARIFARYQGELADIAAGGRENVRSYNTRMSVNSHDFWTRDLNGAPGPGGARVKDFQGTWLNLRQASPTYEFRLWNAAKAAWRQRLCVAFSVAMVEAAMAGVDVTEHDPRPVEEVLAPWFDNQTWAGILRQRFSKGGAEAARQLEMVA